MVGILQRIAGDAAFLSERIQYPMRYKAREDEFSREIARRLLDKWCQLVAHGDWNLFGRRLQWGSLDLTTLESYLGPVDLAPDEPLPSWVETLDQIVIATQKHHSGNIVPPPKPESYPAFAELFEPALAVAREKIAVLCQPIENINSLVSPEAWGELENALLIRLTQVSRATLVYEIFLSQPYGSALLILLDLEKPRSAPPVEYQKFISELSADGMLDFYQRYPVLGRHIANLVELWVEGTSEFLSRLLSDLEAIASIGDNSTTIVEGHCRPTVVSVEPLLSDPHNGGRYAIAVKFDNEYEVIYKPRGAGVEVTFEKLLSYFRDQDSNLDLIGTETIEYDGYCWVRRLHHSPCRDYEAIKRFYHRAGMMLCLVYVLRGNDCHYENIIASSEWPVLIDAETLMQPEVVSLRNEGINYDKGQTLFSKLRQSVLRTGLLPRWQLTVDRRNAYDISGLGSRERAEVTSFATTACGDSKGHSLFSNQLRKYNLPFIDKTVFFPEAYVDEIEIGFERMYQNIVRYRDSLLKDLEGPFQSLRTLPVRFILRGTKVYALLLEESLTAEYLRNGVEFSICLDRLSRSFLFSENRPPEWNIIRSEITQLENLDIPIYYCQADDCNLTSANGIVVQDFFKTAPFFAVTDHISTLDHTDLTFQRLLIHSAFDVIGSELKNHTLGNWRTDCPVLLTNEQFTRASEAIADLLYSKAVQSEDGSLSWLGVGAMPSVDRFQLQVVGSGLYDGSIGISLFYAGLYYATRNNRYRDLAIHAIDRLLKEIRRLPRIELQRFVLSIGIGCGSGVGSLVYGLIRISYLLEEESLILDALKLVDVISPELVRRDTDYDIINGSAGFILGALALHYIKPESSALQSALWAGTHLMEKLPLDADRPRAWRTQWPVPLTGFSHGAAGISYALLRLHAVVPDSSLLAAAREGIAYERSTFMPEYGNWPDFREVSDNPDDEIQVKWCHGAAGIGLARLGCIHLIDDSLLEAEIRVALQTTVEYGLHASDNLCCGNLGRIETLLIGAQRGFDNSLYHIVRSDASLVIDRASKHGYYHLFTNLSTNVLNPGFFQGLAGIGYELLRIAGYDLPSILLFE